MLLLLLFLPFSLFYRNVAAACCCSYSYHSSPNPNSNPNPNQYATKSTVRYGACPLRVECWFSVCTVFVQCFYAAHVTLIQSPNVVYNNSLWVKIKLPQNHITITPGFNIHSNTNYTYPPYPLGVIQATNNITMVFLAPILPQPSCHSMPTATETLPNLSCSWPHLALKIIYINDNIENDHSNNENNNWPYPCGRHYVCRVFISIEHTILFGHCIVPFFPVTVLKQSVCAWKKCFVKHDSNCTHQHSIIL